MKTDATGSSDHVATTAIAADDGKSIASGVVAGLNAEAVDGAYPGEHLQWEAAVESVPSLEVLLFGGHGTHLQFIVNVIGCVASEPFVCTEMIESN